MRNLMRRILPVLGLSLGVILLVWWGSRYAERLEWKEAKQLEAYSQKAKDPEAEEREHVRMKAARADYYHMLLRDPATDKIPPNIRSRELAYSKKLPGRKDLLRMKTRVPGSVFANASISWHLAGPMDLGGRTRALGIDQRNHDIIIAGGVSGGIWKSTDGGTTWAMKTDPNQSMSVTSLAQDPTSPDTWYYTSGEFSGNSASDRERTAFYYGTGIFKSTDNGESWSRLPATKDIDASFNSQYDYMSRIVVSPTTGSIFVASNGVGVLRSQNGGASFSIIQGGLGYHQWADVAVDSAGNIVTVLSSTDAGSAAGSPGIFYSSDDGDSLVNITPAQFLSAYNRSVVAFAPSKPEIVYVFAQRSGSNDTQGAAFFKIDIADLQNPVASDRSANLPDFGDPVGGVNLQGGYNMVVKVKPDDPDFVIIGATNLFRSDDGFATKPASGYGSSNKNKYWIGGYSKANDISTYSHHHPDQHSIVFDPTNPDIVWSGHDGGLSRTDDITAAGVVWEDKDNGYVTSQFYTVSLAPEAGGNRLIGGTQDNGSPTFLVDNNDVQSTSSQDISSGDGAYAHIGHDYIYASSQNGRVYRFTKSMQFTGYVYPSQATEQLFIHPFKVDPNDDGIMYYPGGRRIWRNTMVDEINATNPDGATEGWDSFVGVVGSGYTISTLEVSKANPSNRLYYGAYSSTAVPKLYRLDNASVSSSSPVDISIPSAPSGAFLHDIAINPNDADNVVAVMSNYNIKGIYQTVDGGAHWEAIEGNLEGTASNPGPSVRSAVIFPLSTGPVYFVGTSTGVYSTESPNGSSTIWVHESNDGSAGSIGYSVAEYLDSRQADGKIAVATHGRGIFMGTMTLDGSNPGDVTAPAKPIALTAENTAGNIQLSWQANTEPDLAKYRIYRGADLNTLSLYDSTSAFSTIFTDDDTAFNSHYYRITAVDGNGNESTPSEATASLRDYLKVNTKWELAGMPLTSLSDASLPSGIRVIGFEGAYTEEESLSPHKGYWVKHTEADSIKYDGGTYVQTTVALNQGWNLIGGIAQPIAVADIGDPGSILDSTPVYSYDGTTYQVASTIQPLSGYWIHTSAAGTVELSLNSGAPKEQPVTSLRLPSDTDRIIFTRQGISQSILMTDKPLKREQKMRYLMPPKAPSPPLDVRTEAQYRVIDSPVQEIELTAAAYPVKVTVRQQASASKYRIKAVKKGEEVYFDLNPGTSKLIGKAYDHLYIEQSSSSATPLAFDLMPNYPNPFNPSTHIRYKLGEKAKVNLEVYDILGRRVQRLVNKVQEAGVYTLTFDGLNLSSGTYFIRMRAGEFTQIQKMTLIK